MTIAFKVNMPMSGSKERLKKALKDNINDITISDNGRVSIRREILLDAVKREFDKIDNGGIAVDGLKTKMVKVG
ncbi:hypothetical protein NYO97_19390 [Morganella morganii]|uniref:hypothetical protein n=1 Tax=Morganella morganii TaxID=582 RepID=UPI0010432CAE|nr:hypothetical protein [Morganella morganii]MBS9583564.1 hypothetical protein [Morganella morganii subsp. morganii]MDO7861750.1 hypothetical protein [Morganella morganii]QWL85761.1 hypothetical protein IR216_19745 [Morganella morganii subsp. morganii]UVZ53955.1 hypothetical protein NYO97_19390 [Morganella morganii]WPU18743.1 hypothetical protein SPN40_19250 [Morganella morganii]